MKRNRQSILFMLAMSLGVIGTGYLFAANQQPGDTDSAAATKSDATVSNNPLRPNSPVSADDSLKYFAAHPDVRIEVVACEPNVIDPVALAFDERGRMWVAEMRDYPNGDPANPKSKIRLLEDSDNDGVYETSHTFADNLLFATGLQPWKGGVIATVAGKVLWLSDTDGDNKADVIETWFTGFSEQNPQLRANHPTFAMDNRIYIANGLRGGKVVGTTEKWRKATAPVSVSGRDFRFDPLSGDYEAISGMGQFGLTFDDWGNRFVCSNRNPCKHIILEEGYLKNNPDFAAAETTHDVSIPGEASRVYAINRPWTTSTLHAGQFTAACGVTIFRGNGLPDSFGGNSFTCEPTGSLIHRDVLTRTGVTFESKPGREKIEFLASTDDWFRAVNLAHGPDGALYVADMYRAVIEHPQFMPTELKTRGDLTLGNDKGRIYRIVDKSLSVETLKKRRVDFSKATPAELVTMLDHDNAWHRETAARLIFEKRDAASVAPLTKMAMESTSSRSRMHAMYALAGLNALAPDVVGKRLTASAPDTRHALKLAEPLLQDDAGWADLYVWHAINGDTATQFQAALSLGKIAKTSPQNRVILSALAKAITDRKSDEWVTAAVLTAIGDRPLELLKMSMAILRAGDRIKQPQSRQLLGKIARLLAARNKPDEILAAVETATNAAGLQMTPAEFRVSAAIVSGLGNGLKGKPLRSRIAADESLQRRSRNLFRIASQAAVSDQPPFGFRQECIQLLQHADYEQASPVLAQLAFGSTDNNIRIAAIDSLSAHRNQDVSGVLLPEFSSRTPTVQRAILSAMMATPARIRSLLKAIDAGDLPVNQLNASVVNRLNKHPSPDIRSKARRLLAAAIPKDRAAVLKKYSSALSLDADPKKGRVVFEKNCATCHRVDGLGIDVGPDIADSRSKTPRYLLENILDPNRAVDANYFSYTIVKESGQLLTGVIASESATSITIRQAENKSTTVLRSDIDQISSNGISLMPVGLERTISEQQMADVISFIKNWRYLDGSIPISTGD